MWTPAAARIPRADSRQPLHLHVADIVEILNLQPRGHQAKPYQVRQVRQVILNYRLGGEPDAE